MNPFLPLSLLGAIMDECKGRDGVVSFLHGIVFLFLVFDHLDKIKREIVCLSGWHFYHLLCQIIFVYTVVVLLFTLK